MAISKDYITMTTWTKTLVLVIFVPSLLGLGGWSLSKASNNSEEIEAIKAEYKTLISALNRIESGVEKINKKHEVFTEQINQAKVRQAVTEQRLNDHIRNLLK